MDISPKESWPIILSESSATSVAVLATLVDLSRTPDFFEFAQQHWERHCQGSSVLWKLLIEDQFLLTAIAYPEILSLQKALTLAGFALQTDPKFDRKLIRRLFDERPVPSQPSAGEAMRTLELIEALDDSGQLTRLLLRFANFPDRRVQSKAAKILGQCVDSIGAMEQLFQNPDARVRANLIEGIGRRVSIDEFLPLIERAARDPHARVSSLALALRARAGHAGAAALIKIRTNSKMTDFRQAAQAAKHVAFGEAVIRESDPAPDSVPLGVVDPEPAVTPAVAEVNQ